MLSNKSLEFHKEITEELFSHIYWSSINTLSYSESFLSVSNSAQTKVKPVLQLSVYEAAQKILVIVDSKLREINIEAIDEL